MLTGAEQSDSSQVRRSKRRRSQRAAAFAFLVLVAGWGVWFYFDSRSEWAEERLERDLEHAPCVVAEDARVQFDDPFSPFDTAYFRAQVLVAHDCSVSDLSTVAAIVVDAFPAGSGRWSLETDVEANAAWSTSEEDPPSAVFSVEEPVTAAQLDSELAYWNRLRTNDDPFADVTLAYSPSGAEYDRAVAMSIDVDDSTTSRDVANVLSNLSPPEAASTSWRLALIRMGGALSELTSDSQPPREVVDYALAASPAPGDGVPVIEYLRDGIVPSTAEEVLGTRVVLYNAPTPDGEAWPALLELVRALDDDGRPFAVLADDPAVSDSSSKRLIVVNSEECLSSISPNESQDAVHGFWLSPERPRAPDAISWACL